MMGWLSDVSSYLYNLFTVKLPFFPGNVKLALLIILFCLVAFTEQYVFILSRRIIQHFRSKRTALWKAKITEMITHVIIYADDDDPEALISFLMPTFQKLPLKNSSVRNLLRKELLTYHSNFTGKTQEVLQELYMRLKLDKYAKKELNSALWEKQIEAIRELTQMSVKEEAENMLKYTDDENGQLRMEAQIAYIKLSSENQFRFLDKAKERILDWHQLVLYDVITKAKNISIPSFATWLNSKNESIVMLCLKLINHYQQLETIPQLISLLNHKNPAIRSMVIQVIARMEAEPAESALYDIYESQSLNIKLHILEAFGKIGSGNFLRFLVLKSDDPEFKIRMQALRAIKEHGPTGKDLLLGLYSNESVQNKNIIKHVLDDRIRA